MTALLSVTVIVVVWLFTALAVLCIRMYRHFFYRIPDGYILSTYLRALFFISPKFENWR